MGIRTGIGICTPLAVGFSFAYEMPWLAPVWASLKTGRDVKVDAKQLANLFRTCPTAWAQGIERHRDSTGRLVLG